LSFAVSQPEYIYHTRVHFDEFDALGILHHSRYFHHLERAQQALFQHLLGVPDFNADRDEDIYVVVRGLEARFREPVRRPGEYAVFYRSPRVRAAGLALDFAFAGLDGKIVYCSGRRTVCKLSGQTHRPAEWSPKFRRALADWARGGAP
jgi:acyl-CoA thioester hydrolase